MKYFSKYPVFFTLLILLLVAFAGIAAYDIYLFDADSKAAKKEESAMRRFVSAVNSDPGQAELDAAKANIAALTARLNLLDKDLSRESASILAPSPVKEGYQLTERIRSMVQQWTLEAQTNEIGIPVDYAFSFKKYLDAGAKPPSDAAVEPLWRQASILDNIIKKLFAAKAKNSKLSIISVQREILPVELEEEKAQAAATGRRSPNRTARVIRSNTGDTFEVDEFISARKDGSIKAMGYKIVFAGYSDTMRRFLNGLNSYDLMLVVRSIEVKPTVGSVPTASAAAAAAASPESLADAFAAAIEGDDSSAPSSMADVVQEHVSKEPVVSENLSEFTVVIEFVEVNKDAPKPAQNGAEDGAANEEGGE